MIVDSHCHLDMLDLTSYDGDLGLALQAAKEKGVRQFLCVSVELSKFPQLVAIAQRYPDIFLSVGLHPNEQVTHEPSVDTLLALSQHPLVVAIGETGLDYYRSEGDLTWQHNRFKTHIAVAKQTKKPLIIHTRDAREDTLTMMREENARDAGGVMHCFTETWEMAKAAMDMGFYISFSGIVTFKSAKQLQEVAKKMPLDRMLIETDSPFLAPTPHRGKPNEPAYVYHVAEFLSEHLGIPFEELAQVTTENFQRLFL